MVVRNASDRSFLFYTALRPNFIVQVRSSRPLRWRTLRRGSHKPLTTSVRILRCVLVRVRQANAVTKLHVQVFGEYVRGIMDDSGEGSIEERADAAVGALSAAVEDEDALEALRTQLVDKWTAHEQANSRAQQAAAAAKVAKQQADAEAVRLAMRREVEESKKREEAKAKIVLFVTPRSRLRSGLTGWIPREQVRGRTCSTSGAVEYVWLRGHGGW